MLHYKKICLFTFLLFSFSDCFCNSDFISFTWNKKKNIVIERGGHTGYGSPESLSKITILSALIERMNKEYFNDIENIHLRFGSDCFLNFDQSRKKQKLGLGYYDCLTETVYKIQYDDTSHSHNAIHFYSTNSDINIYQCLKIIYYGITHKNEIIRNQRITISNRYEVYPEYRLIPTITQANIQDIFKHPTPVLDSFLERNKIYSRGGWRSMDRETHLLEYYWKKNQYHIYKVNSLWRPSKIYSFSNQTYDTAGKTLFSVDNIYQILKLDATNYFVFTKSDSFYHVDLTTNSKKGLYKWREPTIPLGSANVEYDSIHIKNGIAYIPMKSDFGGYTLLFDFAKGKMFLDKTSIGPALIRSLQRAILSH